MICASNKYQSCTLKYNFIFSSFLVQNYSNASSAPYQPGGGAQIPVAVNKQYNTPINMYSVDNVMDTLATQTGGMNIG